MTDYEAETRDVEKRWNDPATFRSVAYYCFSVIGLAALAFAAMLAWRSLLAGILVPVILFVGAMGALFRTYQVWKYRGVWAIWHGASWILLVLCLFCLGVPAVVA